MALRVGADASSLQIMVTAILDVRISTVRWRLEEHERPEALPDSVLRLGVRFSDGRVATNLPGGYWTAPEEGPVFLTPHQANTPEELDRVPGAIALQWEVWPTPPAGELTVACAWPAFGVPEQHVVFDGTTMAAAAKRLRRAAPRKSTPDRPAERPAPTSRPRRVRWAVTAWLTPAGLLAGTRENWDTHVAKIAEVAHADDWTADFAGEFLREYESARQAGPDDDEFGWFGRVPGAYRLSFPVFAHDRDEATQRASQRLNVPDDWSIYLQLDTIDP